MLNTYRRNEQQTQEDFFNKIYTSHFIARVRKGCSRFACERELEIKHNCNILNSTLMAVNVVSFKFCWCWGSTLLGADFLFCILSATSLDPNSSGPQAPSAWCGFPYHISPPTGCNSTGRNWTPLGRRTQLSYIIVRRPLDLWNRMFNRHQAEITVMHFRGNSLSVHHSVVAQWDLHLIQYYQP